MVYDIACRREEEEKGEEGEPRGFLFKKDLNSRRVKGPSPDRGRCLFVTGGFAILFRGAGDSSLPSRASLSHEPTNYTCNRHISQRLEPLIDCIDCSLVPFFPLENVILLHIMILVFVWKDILYL